jgi:hypothetical protein
MSKQPEAVDTASPSAEQVRAACIEAALRGYERAAMSGLCGEGALEAAVSAMRMLDLTTLGQSGREQDAS